MAFKEVACFLPHRIAENMASAGFDIMTEVLGSAQFSVRFGNYLGATFGFVDGATGV